MESQTFAHTPLSSSRSFRLLEVLPSLTFKNPVICEIREAILDDHVEYEALSYVWGMPAPGCSVRVGSSTLAVTPNCLEALKHLRLKFKRRVLWIDAICIDQGASESSTKERSHQVELMGEIYSRAETVLGWLGPSDRTTTWTMRKIRWVRGSWLSIWLSLMYTKEVIQYMKDNPGVVFSAADIEEPSHLPEPKLDALAPLLGCEWWSRGWTFQEQALARRCVLLRGRHHVPLTKFQKFYYEITLMFYPEVKSLGSQLRLYYEQAKDSSSSTDLTFASTKWSDDLDTRAKITLCCAFYLQTKMPVDRIYAFYSMLLMCDIPLPKPDYNRPFEIVYEEAVWAWIRSRQDLSILQTAARPTYIPNLPSWVPAYHLGPAAPASIGSDPSELDAFRNFSWGSLMDPDDSKYFAIPANAEYSPGCLRIKGEYVGAITFKRELFKQHDVGHLTSSQDCCWRVLEGLGGRDWSGYYDAMHEMWETLNPRHYGPTSVLIYFEGDRQWSAFKMWFTVMIYTAPQFAHSRSDLLLERSPLEEEHDRINRADREEYMATVKAMQPVFSYLQNHAFCVLDNGMMCLANSWCEEGDEVFLLRGADSPFVLRKDGDKYRLVGPVFVQRLHKARPWRFDGDDLQDITLV